MTRCIHVGKGSQAARAWRQIVKAVHRQKHNMHAYTRFRERPAKAGAPRFVAWCEPAHDVLPQVAKSLVSRLGKVTWLIATLRNTSPLVNSGAELVDCGEALWLTYYRSIFNLARLNAQLMQATFRHASGRICPKAPWCPR